MWGWGNLPVETLFKFVCNIAEQNDLDKAIAEHIMNGLNEIMKSGQVPRQQREVFRTIVLERSPIGLPVPKTSDTPTTDKPETKPEGGNERSRTDLDLKDSAPSPSHPKKLTRTKSTDLKQKSLMIPQRSSSFKAPDGARSKGAQKHLRSLTLKSDPFGSNKRNSSSSISTSPRSHEAESAQHKKANFTRVNIEKDSSKARVKEEEKEKDKSEVKNKEKEKDKSEVKNKEKEKDKSEVKNKEKVKDKEGSKEKEKGDKPKEEDKAKKRKKIEIIEDQGMKRKSREEEDPFKRIRGSISSTNDEEEIAPVVKVKKRSSSEATRASGVGLVKENQQEGGQKPTRKGSLRERSDSKEREGVRKQRKKIELSPQNEGEEVRIEVTMKRKESTNKE